jgi:hypothetical protein
MIRVKLLEWSAKNLQIYREAGLKRAERLAFAHASDASSILLVLGHLSAGWRILVYR